MSKSKVTAMLLAFCLFLFAAGCKKKIPPPPPPPPPERAVVKPPAGKPIISSFTAEPSTIEKGQAVTLRWSVSNASDITIDQGLGPVTSSGSRQVFPSATTTYTLVANSSTGSDTKSATVNVSSAPPPPPEAPNKQTTLGAAETLARDVQDVYFGYDKSDIAADAQSTLTKNADVLKKLFADNPGFNVVVEGHCDERGSAEYNLGLGDQRAARAKEFLVQLGVAADRLRTITYGKERPQCTDANEQCYGRNRRAHFAAAQ